LKVTRQTVSNYTSYLEEAFLIKLTTRFTGSYVAGTRKAKKIYLSDHGMINALQDKEIPDEHHGQPQLPLTNCKTNPEPLKL